MDQYSNERRWYLKCTSKTSIAKKKISKAVCTPNFEYDQSFLYREQRL